MKGVKWQCIFCRKGFYICFRASGKVKQKESAKAVASEFDKLPAWHTDCTGEAPGIGDS